MTDRSSGRADARVVLPGWTKWARLSESFDRATTRIKPSAELQQATSHRKATRGQRTGDSMSPQHWISQATHTPIVSTGSSGVNSFGAGIRLPEVGGLRARVDADHLLAELRTQGWVSVPPLLPAVPFFERTFSLLDEVLDILEADPLASAALDDVKDLWLANQERCNRWCHTPPGWRDRVQDQGRPDKSYLQSVPGFNQLVRYSPSGEYLTTRYPSLMKLLTHLEMIATETTTIFSDVVTALDRYMPIATATRIVTEPTVVVKALRYSPGQDWGTAPHRDKSALSLICWSDEPSGHLAVASCDRLPVSRSDFALVAAPEETRAATGATLLVGGTLEQAGVQLPPSFHAVIPIESRRPRHALIAFLLVPYLNVDDMETTLDIP